MRLIVRKDGNEIGATDLGDNVIYLGRSKKNDLVLSDGDVSRRHAKVYAHDGRIFLEDLKSANGTQLEERGIERVEIHSGMTFHIGPFAVTLESSKSEDDVPRGEVEEMTAGTVSESVDEGERNEATNPPTYPPKSGEESFLDAISVKPKHEDESGDLKVLRNFLKDGEANEPDVSESSNPSANIVPMEKHARLVRLDEKHEGEEVPLDQPSLTIGASDECDIVLTDPRVSQQHARVEKTDAGYVVHDTEESTGTFVDGVPVRERELETHDILHVGTARFEYLEGTARSRAQGPKVIERKTVVTRAPVWTVVTTRWTQFITMDWRLLVVAGLGVGILFAVVSTRKPKPTPSRTVVSSPPATAEADRVVRFHLDRAQKLIGEKKYDEAEARLQLVLNKIAANDPVALELMKEVDRGREAERQQEDTRKEKERQRLDEIQAQLIKGDRDRDAGRFLLARQAYEKVFSLDADNREAKSRLADLSKRETRARKATLAKQKSDAELQELYTQGVLKFEAGDLGKAEELLNQVATRKGHRYQASAQKLIDEIHRATDEKVKIRLDEVRLLIDSDELVEARVDLQEITQQFPRNKEAGNLMKELREKIDAKARLTFTEGIAFEELAEDRNAAREKYEETLRLVPDRKHEYHRKAKKKIDQLGGRSPALP